jgi:hypothetical protein
MNKHYSIYSLFSKTNKKPPYTTLKGGACIPMHPVIDGKTGLLVEKDDVAGLAAALRRLRDDPALRIRAGERGREVAAARFTVEHMAKSYENLWHQVVSAPHAPRFRVKRPRD